MPTFGDIGKELKSIDIASDFVKFAKTRAFNDKIIKTIQDRLFKTGVTGDGQSLKTDNAAGGGVYSIFTERVKRFEGQRVSNVTLKDTGEFYDSFVTQVNKFELIIDADFLKDDGHIQRNFTELYSSSKEFEESVLSLTDDELLELVIDAFLLKWIEDLKK